jgi:integrase/recombinase XerD
MSGRRSIVFVDFTAFSFEFAGVRWPMATISPLRRRMIEDMTIRNLAPSTQQSYVRAVAKLSRHFGGSPDRLGLEDVRRYQVYLASERVS